MTQLDTLTPTSSVASQVAPDVYRVATGISNAYLVVLRQGGYVMVDAGGKGYGRKMLQAARELFEGVRPEAILLTHGHFDHAGGLPEILREWPEVPVFAHPLELPYLNGGVRYPPGDPTVGGTMAELSRFMDTSRPTDVPTRVQPLPEESAEFDVMPGWRLCPSPGHTPGHMSLWNPEERILLAGDAIITMNPDNPLKVMSSQPELHAPPPYATYNWHHARQSARALADLEPVHLCAGHGMPMRGQRLARDLKQFAEFFPVPRRGRYVVTAARFSRSGPAFVPPAPVDYVKHITLVAGTIAAGAALYLALRPRRR